VRDLRLGLGRRPRFRWTEGLWPRRELSPGMEDNRAAEIAATFRRIQRPLRWPMTDFSRTRIANRGFVGFRFSRLQGRAAAGFSFGFVLRDDAVPGVNDPPEVVAYAFARPVPSSLHTRLTARADAAGRRLIASGRKMGFRFEFFPEDETFAVRHRSLARVPREIFVLVASDFFMLSYAPLRASRFLERVKRATSRPG
jgi:hypothetical protein